MNVKAQSIDNKVTCMEKSRAVSPPEQRRRKRVAVHLGRNSTLSWLATVSSQKAAMARLTALLFLPVLIESAFSISFFLPVNTRKCLREEIHKDVLVTGDYEISEQPNTKTNLKVSAELRIANVNATSVYSITTKYYFCFSALVEYHQDLKMPFFVRF